MAMRLLCAAVLLTGLMTAAHALTVSYEDTIDLKLTNWTDSVSIPKFDTSLGTLTSITFELSGHVEGTVRFESLDSSPTTVTAYLQALLTLQRPDSTILVQTIPVADVVEAVTAYDGTVDFAGTSGRTYSDLTGDKTETTTTPPPPSDLTLFSGVGTIELPVIALGQSSGSGGGNLITQFITSASAYVKVTYTYETDQIVPEPSTLLLLGGLIGGVVAVIRRKRS